jgi:predicted nucleotide-binding protein
MVTLEVLFMDLDQAKLALNSRGLAFTEEALANGHGAQLRVSGGPVVTVYNSGKIVLGGKNQEMVSDLFGTGSLKPAQAAAVATAMSRKVFVVYGHDVDARNELEAMLRRWGLDPIILDQLTSGGQTIIEKLEKARGEANFAVVLATPDDEGHRRDHPEEKAHRARQNVVLELGMMLAVLGRSKVAVVLKTDVAMERPSDIHGLIYVAYKDDVKEAALTLAKEINAQGIKIDLSKI